MHPSSVVGVLAAAQPLKRLVDASVLFLTFGPGFMMFYSGLLGSLQYWIRRDAAADGSPLDSLVEGINVGLVVGFVTGFPFAILIAFGRLAGLIGP
jgi:hypothetical protein